MKLFSGSLSQLENALDIRAARHSVLVENVAQVDTPGYVAREVNFDAAFEEALSSRDDVDGAKRAAAAHTEPTEHEVGAALDGNTVDLDRTMAALAENGLQFGASARAASKHLAMLRAVVNDGVG